MNILAVRNDRFGEFLLTVPALRALKSGRSGVRLAAAVTAAVAPLARLVPEIDDIIVWPSDLRGPGAVLQAAGDLRRRRIDAALVFNPSAGAHQAVFLSAIPRRIGYARKHGFLLTERLTDDKDLGRRHETESNLMLAARLGALALPPLPDLTLPPETFAAADRAGLEAGSAFVAVHPWTSDPVKQWPLERFRELVLVLARRRRVVVIGRPEPWHAPLALPADAHIIDLSGRTTLPEAAAVLSRAAVLVSGDSGPVHLASAVGTPVVALFRNDMPGKNPERWGPRGADHFVVARPSPDAIMVDDVLSVLKGAFHEDRI